MSNTYGYIYLTKNEINGKRYIGQHKSKDWDYNYFGSGKYLKRAIRKYRIENFTCFPLAWAWDKDGLNKLEIDYIAHYKPEYNLTAGGEGFTGNHSDETKKKMSESKKGNKNSMHGKYHCEETKRKIGKIHKGKIISEETKQKIGAANIGKIFTQNHKQKISEANKGKHYYSEEIKKKMSESHKGKITWSKGKIFSEDHRRKLSEGKKGEKNPNFGRINEKHPLYGKHWFNNGIINVLDFDCPNGFILGRLKLAS